MATTGTPCVANPIAERRLSVVGEPGREIVITLGKPRPSRKLSAWACSFSIEGIPDVRRRTAYGGDSLQALQMAIEGARVVLEASGLVCTLEGGEPGEVGLPRSVPTFEGSDFAKKIERYIDREMKKFIRAAKAQRGARARRHRRIG